MKYKPALTRLDTPSRKTRKSSRREIFLHNRKMKKIQKKARRSSEVAS